MKNTLFVTLDFPPRIGGVSTYYENMCAYLPPEHLLVLAPQCSGDQIFDKNQKYRIYRKNVISRSRWIWPKWLRSIRLVENIIDKHGIEFLLVGNILPLGTVALILKQKKKIPYGVCIHGMDITVPKGRKKILLKKILKNAERIIANSQFMKKKIVDFGVSPRTVEVVYPCPNINPNTDEFLVQELRIKYRLEEKKVLLTVGRLMERKGHSMVIRSIFQIKKIFPHIIYLIAGEGPCRKDIEKLVDTYDLKTNIILLGLVDDRVLKSLYELCDVFIMTPYELQNNDIEGFGTVYLEAAIFGKPSVASISGGIPEAVIDEKTGLLVQPRNAAEITQALLKLLKNPSYANRLGMQAMERVHREFKWNIQIEKVKKILSYNS